MSTPTEVFDHYHTYGRREGEEDFPNTLISGISTFLGARVIPPVKAQLVEAGVKAAVLGMPWEGTNTCRPGASYGPRAIRRATEHYLSYHGEFQVDLFDELVIKMIRAFVGQGVEAYVITECSPVHDLANKAARVATRLALDALGVRANPQGTGHV